MVSASRSAGAGALKRESEKRRLYEEDCPGVFEPIVSSILVGGVRLQSKCWLVARRAQENVPDILAKDFVSFWMGAPSCELKRADYGKQYAGPPQSMAQRSNSYFGQLHVMFVLPLGPVGPFLFCRCCFV